MVATKSEVRVVKDAVRRQKAAMVGVRRWHEDALQAQAQQFSDIENQAQITQLENVRCGNPG